MTARQRFDYWLVALLEADTALHQAFAALDAPLVVRRDGGTLRDLAGQLPARQRNHPVLPFVQFALMGGTFEQERCGPWQEARLSYLVKVVVPGNSPEAATAISARLEALLNGTGHSVGSGTTADDNTITADTVLVTADNGATGARWLMRLAEPVAYTERADPFRYVHDGAIYSVHLVA